jgi:hypothetical protein
MFRNALASEVVSSALAGYGELACLTTPSLWRSAYVTMFGNSLTSEVVSLMFAGIADRAGFAKSFL